jgi:DNA polymerase III subunit gamma/tau
MESYLVLARKYRSRSFDEVIGQEPIARTLRNAIAAGRIAHAYLFTGTRGVGKTTMARLLAKSLNCLSFDEPTAEPCNECAACTAIARGEDMDVIEIDGASNNSVDEVRQLRENAIFTPARCRYKVYYIDEVHMLSQAAFNALLKTLEEPPDHVKFIFSTTETEKIPATIHSRCQRFDFRDIPTARIAEHLATICKAENVPAEDDALFRVARSAAGSMRDALSLLDQLLAGAETVSDAEVIRVLGTPGDERMIAIVTALADSNAAAALGELDEVLQSGVTLASVTLALNDVFRNMMLASACGGDSQLIELPEMQRKAVAELATRFDTPALVHAVGLIQNLTRTVRNSSVARALVEAALIRLAESEKFLDPEALTERIERLAAGGALPTTPKKKS